KPDTSGRWNRSWTVVSHCACVKRGNRSAALGGWLRMSLPQAAANNAAVRHRRRIRFSSVVARRTWRSVARSCKRFARLALENDSTCRGYPPQLTASSQGLSGSSYLEHKQCRHRHIGDLDPRNLPDLRPTSTRRRQDSLS